MRTVEEVKRMLADAMQEARSTRVEADKQPKDSYLRKSMLRQVNGLLKNIEFYTQIWMYLETEPREEGIRLSLEKYEALKKKIDLENLEARKKGAMGVAKERERAHKYPDLVRKIHNLKFILNEK